MLKHCFEKLQEYCGIWCLDINIDKTKIVIFNKSRKMFPFKFYYNEKEIEIVQNYKHLGVVFSSTRSFAKARIDLYNRALKAYFKMKGNFENYLQSIDISLHVFDYTVKPILLYGCEVWGTSCYG